MPSEQPPTRVEKCPTCGSDDPTKVHHGPPKGSGLLGFHISEWTPFDCPDSFHDPAPPGEQPREGKARVECALCHGTHFYKQPMAAVHGQSVNTICPYCGPPTNDTAQPEQPRGEEVRADERDLRLADVYGVLRGAYGTYDEDTETFGASTASILSAIDYALRGDPGCSEPSEWQVQRSRELRDLGDYLGLPAPPGGEGDDLAARLEARADNADEMAAEVARNQSNYGESGPRHHARLLAAAYAFRKAAEMARASTHPEQSVRVDWTDGNKSPAYLHLVELVERLIQSDLRVGRSITPTARLIASQIAAAGYGPASPSLRAMNAAIRGMTTPRKPNRERRADG